MKKLLLLIAALGVVLALRFVEVEAPQNVGPAPIQSCRSADAAPDPNVPLCEAMQKIGAAYEKEILPIFSAKCLMCHGTVAKMPLYSKIPPTAWLVSHDIDEAKEHMDMSFGWPFHGKDAKTPKEALSEIAEVVSEKEMPPTVYKIMHWHAALTPEEAKTILAWTNSGQGILK